MNPEWLCYVNGQEYGPYTWTQLVQMAAAGNVVPATHVRRNFDSQWYLAEHVPGLFATASAPVATPKTAAHPVAAPSASGAMKAIPAGRPVAKGVPIVQQQGVQPAAASLPQGVPRGRVVSAPAAPPVAAAGPAAWSPVVNTGAAPAMNKAAARTDDEDLTGTKPDKSKTMVLALGGAILAIGLLGAIAIIWKMNAPPAAEPVAAKGVVIATEETDPGLSSERGATAPAKPATKTTATAAKTDTAAPRAAAAKAEADTLVKAVKKWSQIEKFSRLGIRDGLVVDKVTVWLAVDAAGKRVDPNALALAAKVPPVATPPVAANTTPVPGAAPEIVAPSTAPTLGDLVPGSQAFAIELPKFVFVELQIKNASARPQQYSGWNSEATAALLVDDEGLPLPLAPIAATPTAARKSATEIQPGESTPDTLVFTMNEPQDNDFRLVLPQKALSKLAKGSFGIAISPAALAANSGTGLAQNPGGMAGPGATRSSTSIPIPGLEEEPKPLPPPAAVPPVAAPGLTPEPEMKKPVPDSSGKIPIPGLSDEPEMKKPVPDSSGKIPIPGLSDEPAKPADGPKKPEEVPNTAPPPKT
ncbi:hypothetical protein ETAA8_02230 [Anatilimnocola aggregata]|uniref:GYF domain-containing protein n=1 Tax=Anatilimnocola aggregata TaxID=2528021 RepID=A0A517Y4H9_9BACT|nr:DUF4339 domain-containing protein [Anatilimnocola aggregata]QDU25161.1 hypothetical protein ETAA8_02230 [Anatilimnocola aggregata]